MTKTYHHLKIQQMSLKIKNKYVFIAVLLLALTIFGFGGYLGMSGQRSKRLSDETAYKEEIKRYKLRIGQDSLYVVQANQTIASQRELIKQGEIDRETLRKLNIKHLNEISKLKLQIDTLLEDVQHNGQVVDILDSQIANLNDSLQNVSYKKRKAILLPFEFYHYDAWMPDSLKGSFDKNGKLSIRFGLVADIRLISAIDKTTKKNTYTVLTDCPYIGVLSVTSFKTDVPKPKRYSIGLQVGYGVNKNFELSPYVGIGLTRSIIRF